MSPSGTHFTLAYLRRTMNLQKYHTANLPELMKIISKNGIGMDDYLDRFSILMKPQQIIHPTILFM